MNKASNEALSKMAARLHLSLIRDHMDEMLSSALQAKMTPRETLEYFLSKEIEQREATRIKMGIMSAHFPRTCTLESFDMTAQPSLDPGIIRELKTLEWINRAENVLFLGPPGVGKTHLAIGFGRQAIHSGYSVYFYNAAVLIDQLEKAQANGTLTEKLNALAKPRVLIIDELGYLNFSPMAANLMFRLVCKRYESKSIVITSNRPIGEWGLIFGDPTAATAIIDRLAHHCIPVTILGDSYRIRSNKRATVLRKNS